MIQRLLTGWTFQRALFLIMGVSIIVQAIMEMQWIGAALGIYFAAMGLFNFGCASGGCFGGSCATPTLPQKGEAKDITFNEIK